MLGDLELKHGVACPTCSSYATTVFLRRKNVPVHQNFIVSDEKSAKSVVRGDLDLAICESCGFIFNQSFDISQMQYGENYDNTQDFSPYFKSYLANLSDLLIHGKKIQNCTIVEIGCGKGTFLRSLVENEQWKNKGYGFDPSYTGPELDLDGKLIFEKHYYDTRYSDISADVVICRHVIEHVPNPLALLKMIRKTLGNSPKAHVFFETPTVEWILKNQVIWDFFYEHCSYFTSESLTTLFELAGFKVEEVKNVFEGQYLWLEASLGNKELSIHKNPGNIPHLAENFGRLEQNHWKEWETRIHTLSKSGKIGVWGAGAKGVTFTNIVDPNHEYIDCIIDLNPKKQEKYLVGTGHPIVSYRDITTRNIRNIILMNPNYYKENLNLLNNSLIDVNLIM